MFTAKSFGFSEKFSQKLNNRDQREKIENGSSIGGGIAGSENSHLPHERPGFEFQIQFHM